MTQLILVHGGSGLQREAAIAGEADPQMRGAAIIEGLAGGHPALQELADAAVIRLVRVAPGCPCCTGQLTMRTTLNRLLREKPAQLFLSLADARHKDQVRTWLEQGPYRELLELGPELDCG